jgi:hypothetical protein
MSASTWGLASVFFCVGCQYVSKVSDLEIERSTLPDWSCLDSPKERADTTLVKYVGPVRQVLTDEPVLNVDARLCRSDSSDGCSQLATPPIHASDGIVHFEVPGTFNGYIELESPGMMPAVIELWRPVGLMRLLPELKMIQPEMLSFFASKQGATIDFTLGHALFWVEDCKGQRASGVRVHALESKDDSGPKLLPNTRGYYAVGGRVATLGVDQTDDSGSGGIVNLPINDWTFEARRAVDDRVIARLGARIRPGQTTFFVVEPD